MWMSGRVQQVSVEGVQKTSACIFYKIDDASCQAKALIFMYVHYSCND